MSKYLQATKETVEYSFANRIILYNNVEFESFPLHWHAPMEIIMVLEDSYTIGTNKEEFVLGINDIAIIAPGTVHSCTGGSGRRIVFQIDIGSLIRVQDKLPMVLTNNGVTLVTKDTFPDIHEECVRLMKEINNEYFSNLQLMELSILSKTAQMLVLISRSSAGMSNIKETHPNRWQEHLLRFDDICNYIQNNCTENLSLEAVAEMNGFSKFHFSRLFKEYTGTTFYRYVNNCRISNAEMLMSNEDMSITDVAINSGYSSISAFIRMFKEIKGCTPSEFRKLHQTGEFSRFEGSEAILKEAPNGDN